MPQSNPIFDTESLPDFHVNVPANFQILASGGTPPYSFAITEGTLPKGLSLDKSGKISGTARRVADTTVSIKLTDKVRASVTQAFAVRVEPLPQKA